MQYPNKKQNRLPRYRNIAIKSQILQYFQSGTASIHEISWKISMNLPNLLQKSLKLVEFWAHCAMQYYTANAIFIGQTEPRSVFPKPPSPSWASQSFIVLSNVSFRWFFTIPHCFMYYVCRYPIILSIENHCSLPQQKRMAEVFTSVLGGLFYIITARPILCLSICMCKP